MPHHSAVQFPSLSGSERWRFIFSNSRRANSHNCSYRAVSCWEEGDLFWGVFSPHRAEGVSSVKFFFIAVNTFSIVGLSIFRFLSKRTGAGEETYLQIAYLWWWLFFLNKCWNRYSTWVRLQWLCFTLNWFSLPCVCVSCSVLILTSSNIFILFKKNLKSRKKTVTMIFEEAKRKLGWST